MQKYIKLAVLTVLVMPLFMFAVVNAHEEGEDDGNTSSQSQQEPKKQKTPDTSSSGVKERLEKKKAELKTRLEAAESAKIVGKCKASQVLIQKVQDKVKGVETSRGSLHSNSVDRLNHLVEKLKEKGVDTAELESQIAALQTKIQTFQTDLESYKQAVSDLVNVDCTTDPTAFKTALENARSLRAKVHEDVKAIRAHINDTIKPILKAIREQLASETNEQGGQ